MNLRWEESSRFSVCLLKCGLIFCFLVLIWLLKLASEGGWMNWSWLGGAQVVPHMFHNTESDLVPSGIHSSFSNFFSASLARFSSLPNVIFLMWERKRESYLCLSSLFSSTPSSLHLTISVGDPTGTLFSPHLCLICNTIKCFKVQVQRIKKAYASNR